GARSAVLRGNVGRVKVRGAQRVVGRAGELAGFVGGRRVRRHLAFTHGPHRGPNGLMLLRKSIYVERHASLPRCYRRVTPAKRQVVFGVAYCDLVATTILARYAADRRTTDAIPRRTRHFGVLVCP